MPLTIITLKSVPSSLRGDLSKWMQEIATGVYVGNFNVKIRENRWERVKDSVKTGEATLTYSSRNEIGYGFETLNTDREVVQLDGIPLVLIPEKNVESEELYLGFSNAAKYRKVNKYKGISKKREDASALGKKHQPYVVIDVETDGLEPLENRIIEFGAYKTNGIDVEEFHCMVNYDGKLPESIKKLTGINEKKLNDEGQDRFAALQAFMEFIGNHDIVGYKVDFDIAFINQELKHFGLNSLKNKRYDLMKYVKKEKMFLSNYKLQTVLKEYGIDEIVPHRALLDAKLIYALSTKVNKFGNNFIVK